MLQDPRFTFQSVVKSGVIAIFLLFVVSYIIFQGRFMIMGPQITLENEPALHQNNRQITISGTAFNISRLWMNDRPIFTDAQGSFNEEFVLENGYTITTIRAEDRYGRETTIKRTFVYTPASF